MWVNITWVPSKGLHSDEFIFQCRQQMASSHSGFTTAIHFLTNKILHQRLKMTGAWHYAWWRHQIELFFALLALCAGNSPVNSPHKGQWRGALMFSLICAWINHGVNNCEAGDLRRHRAHYDINVMVWPHRWHIRFLLRIFLPGYMPVFITAMITCKMIINWNDYHCKMFS